MLYSRLILVEINFKVVSSIREIRELIRKKNCVLEGSSASRLNFVYLESTKKKKKKTAYKVFKYCIQRLNYYDTSNIGPS